MSEELGPPDLTLRGNFAKRDERRYAHVPFDVPAGVDLIHLRLAHNDRIGSDPFLAGGNTLDIGLFDARGTEAGGPGFRGWSGSERSEITVARDWATPPYACGPVGAGTWHLLLGPYKVGPRGLDWEARVWFDAPVEPEPPQPSAEPGAPRAPVGDRTDRDLADRTAPDVADRSARDALTAPRAGWLRGDLHCHTIYSDGDSTPLEVLRAAALSGLDFLGVTDHNGAAHHAAYGAGGDGLPVVIPGVEVTTYGGHWNAHGTDRWWEFREPDSEAVHRTMSAAAYAGALVTICHPKPFGPQWEHGGPGPAHAIEVWNGRWIALNSVSLGWWDELLRRGTRVVAVGGSDTHLLRTRRPDPRHADELGTPTTWVNARADARAVVDALRAGRSFVSASPRGPQLYLEPHPARPGRVCVEVRDGNGSALVLVDDRGIVASEAVSADRWDAEHALPARSRYLRAQLVDTTGALLALANPVWAERL